METIAPAAPTSEAGYAHVQRRILAVLVAAQVLGGVGMVVGVSVSVLLLARIAGGPGLSGLAQSAVSVGSALLALPVARLMQRYGRRPGLTLGYLAGAAGAVLVIVSAVLGSVTLALLGMFLFGGGTTASLQVRYTATDLAAPDRRGRHLSVVMWATTVGAVLGPTLAAPADRLGQPLGLPPLSGPFGFSLIGFAAAALLVTVLLRPDPLLLARVRSAGGLDTAPSPAEPGTAPPPRRARGPLAHALGVMLRSRDASLGLLAAAVGYAVMIAVMVMTPLHIDGVVSSAAPAGHSGHGHSGYGHDAEVLRLVGLVLSVHVAGMFAFSPLVGYASDRFGRRTVILAGTALLLAACLLAGTSGDRSVQLSAALFLLGLGWSCTMIAGSTLLTEAVPQEVRPSAQGLGDLLVGLSGATAGALAGVVVELAGYPGLAGAAAALTLPLLVALLVAARAGPRTVVPG